MGTKKKWYASKTVWGGIIALVAGIAGAMGFGVGAESQETLVTSFAAIGSAVGGVIAVYGRVKAKDEVG